MDSYGHRDAAIGAEAMRNVVLALAGSALAVLLLVWLADVGGWWRAFAGAWIGYWGLVFLVSLEADDV